MPKCKNCYTRLKWSQILKANMSYSMTTCEHCGANHQITWFSRFLVTLLTTFPLIIFIFTLTPFTNVFLTLISGLAIACVGFLLTPFVVDYEEKHK
ncbi:TIGR04104 family putative zinc finger protein [Alkalihalobacterium chitinilyticum]|uniref:Cxxc_20_cxxc protein n=1 Tax=Alkalihalobacterium chitinilyticum TaxID=2980103 RepID=A0ABT5VCZ8_9BACI|nr:TIGR04104 family putative zinc finger protein [Alkalihalobacterium chitinilyticum]MDE5413318.1 hypothetical protein [Alkalihalobacterium chitinilyticum]